MQPSRLGLVATVVLVVAVSASTNRWAAPASSSVAAKPPSVFLPRPPTQPPREIVFYGHIRSLTRVAGRFELRVDPAEFLGGTTANRAAIDDKVIQPGEAVPNDYYVRDEGHRLLTYVVPANARVVVITTGVRATAITVAELAKNRRRYAPKNGWGFWIRIATDTVRSLDQQYQP